VKFLCVFCVLCGFACRLPALDRHAFTFTRYDLKIRIEPEQQRFAARGTLRLRNDSDAPQKSLSLQISSTLSWLSIHLSGKPVEFVSQPYISDVDHTGALSEAIVVLAEALPPKQSIEFEVGYEGVIPQDTTRLTRIGVPPDTAKRSDWDQISRSFTAVRGIGYVAWYPISTEAVSLSEADSVTLEVGRWKQREVDAAMNVSFDYPRDKGVPSSLECNGQETPPASEAMDTAYSAPNHCSLDPLRRLVPLFAMGEFEWIEKPAVNISYLPAHKAGADDYALAVEQVAPSITTWFGDHREDANQKAQTIDLPEANDSPFESGSTLLMPLTADETTLLLSALRQMTHLYFSSSRMWISQGLAGYAEVSYILGEKGRDAALVYLQSHRAALVEAEKENLSVPNDHGPKVALIDNPDDFYVQVKAMNVFWMLREIVGDTALSAALHSYTPSDDKDARYLETLIEAQSHRDLKWFFDDWVYHDRGLPDLRIAEVYPRQVEEGSYLVTITVENRGGAGAEVPVTAHIVKGETTQRLLVAAKSTASIRIVTPVLPQQVTVNDGSVPERESETHVYKIETTH
jgi:hypothetical protein